MHRQEPLECYQCLCPRIRRTTNRGLTARVLLQVACLGLATSASPKHSRASCASTARCPILFLVVPRAIARFLQVVPRDPESLPNLMPAPPFPLSRSGACRSRLTRALRCYSRGPATLPTLWRLCYSLVLRSVSKFTRVCCSTMTCFVRFCSVSASSCRAMCFSPEKDMRLDSSSHTLDIKSRTTSVAECSIWYISSANYHALLLLPIGDRSPYFAKLACFELLMGDI